MLPSSLIRKLLAITGVLLLLISSNADALGLHRCAHHDALPQSADEHAGHHDNHSGPAEEQHSGGCTCVGTCSLAGAILTPAAPSTHIAVAPAVYVARPIVPVLVRAYAHAHLLPFATAPPVSL